MQEHVDEAIEKDTKLSKHLLSMSKVLKESKIRYIGLANVYIFYAASFVAGIMSFSIFRRVLNQYPAAILLSIIIFYIPTKLLKVEVSLRRRNIRRQLPNFFLTLIQFMEATENIFDVLEATVKKIKNPLKGIFAELIRNYKSGKDIEVCIEIMKSRVDNPLLIKFANDIKNSEKNGISPNRAIEEYIVKAYNNEINYSERVAENSVNITSTLMIFGFTIYALFALDKFRPGMAGVFINNNIGKVAVNIIIILIVIIVRILSHSVTYEDMK